MASATCAGRTILIVAPDINAALFLQDRVVKDGGRVITAYSPQRALLLARNVVLSDAVVDVSIDGADEIVRALKARNVSYLFHAGSTARGAETTESDAMDRAMVAVADWKAVAGGQAGSAPIERTRPQRANNQDAALVFG